MNDAVLAIGMQIIRIPVSRAVGLDEKIKVAMASILKENFLSVDDDTLFKSALGAVLLDVGKDSEDGKRLVRSIELLRRFSAFFNAAQAGIKVDILDVLPEPSELVLPLISWWMEAKKEL